MFLMFGCLGKKPLLFGVFCFVRRVFPSARKLVFQPGDHALDFTREGPFPPYPLPGPDIAEKADGEGLD